MVKFLNIYSAILFIFLNQNDLISPAQSGFKPSDSCINQLLLITPEIYHFMDDGYEICGVFLDISIELVKRSPINNRVLAISFFS